MDSAFTLSRRMLALTAATFAVLWSVGCGAGRLPVPNAADAARVGVALPTLERGRSLYVAACSSCHLPVSPVEHQQARWPVLVDEMSERSHLTAESRAEILQYLTAYAAK
jgi:cytochrome c5